MGTNPKAAIKLQVIVKNESFCHALLLRKELAIVTSPKIIAEAKGSWSLERLVIEARISHLAYSQEIAAAMLQRQQASAVVAARSKIVEGAVGMVKMALDQLSGEKIVELDDKSRAHMVSNLLVVLCSDRHAQPVVNAGSGG